MPEETDLAQTAEPAAAPGQVIAPGAPPPEVPTTSAEPPAPPEPPAPTEPLPAEVPDSSEALTWTAAEFVTHQKSAGWYGLLALGTAALAGLIYLLTKDLISTTVVVVGAILFGFYAARQPKDLQYQLDGQGFAIGNKYYDFDQFRSFALAQEGSNNSVVFTPLKRFAPLTTIYYRQQDEEKIVNLLSDRLPFEEHRHDAIDRFMNRIHF